MKKGVVGAIALLSTLTLAACSSSNVVVKTSAGNVTKEEFYTALKNTSGAQTLQKLTITKVLEANVSKKADLLSEAKSEVATQVAQYNGESNFEAVLKQNGITSIDAYTQTVYLNKLITEAVKAKTSFSDEEIQTYYDSWTPKLTVQHILIATSKDGSNDAEAKQKAEDLIKQLDEGADFTELAKANSQDTGSASNGGTVGPFSKDEMVTEFSDAAFGLENVGDYTKTPVKTTYGYHIIKLTEKTEKDSLDAMKDSLVEEMKEKKLKDSSYVQETVVNLVKDAKVEIKDKDLTNALDTLLDSSKESSSNSSNE